MNKKIPESKRLGYTNNTIEELMKGFLTTSVVMILKGQPALMLVRRGQNLTNKEQTGKEIHLHNISEFLGSQTTVVNKYESPIFIKSN